MVFTLEDLAPVCPAHDYFMQCLKKEYSTGTGDESKLMFEAKRFSTGDLPQHLDFERTNEMVCVNMVTQYKHSSLSMSELVGHIVSRGCGIICNHLIYLPTLKELWELHAK